MSTGWTPPRRRPLSRSTGLEAFKFSVYILVPIVATAVITDVRFINWALDWETTISPQTMRLMQQMGEQEAQKTAAARQAAADRIASRKQA